MIHYLTVGMLNTQHVKSRLLVATRELPIGVSKLVSSYSDRDTSWTLNIIMTPEYVRCIWYAPRLNHTSMSFAIDALRTCRCVAADIEHGRLVPLSELLTFR